MSLLSIVLLSKIIQRMKLYYLFLKSLLLEYLCPDYSFIMDEVCNRDYGGDLYTLAMEVKCGNVVIDISDFSKELFLDIMNLPDDKQVLNGLVTDKVFDELSNKANEYYLRRMNGQLGKDKDRL